jgi:hypothetical protein
MRFTKVDDKVIAELESIKSNSIFVSDEIDSKISDILNPVIDGSTLEDLIGKRNTIVKTLSEQMTDRISESAVVMVASSVLDEAIYKMGEKMQ